MDWPAHRPDGLIPGWGPIPCPAMLVGEAGGRDEHRLGRPFVGKAGEVLTAYLRAAGIARPEAFVTNVFPFWTGEGNPDPSPEQIRREEWRLVADIKRVRPRVIATVGRIATQWFLGPDVEMQTVHGIPHESRRAPGATVVPCYHPAAGFYEPEKAAHSQDDFLRFSYYLRNPVEVKRKPRIRVVLHKTAPKVIRDAAVDTEGLEGGLGPWGMSWSFDGRTTHVWLYAPGKRPPRLEGTIWFHNALHDLKILRAMEIDTSTITRIEDTMVRLFNLQLEPQGLKPASYRHNGLRMQSFDEVVRSHHEKLAIAWLKHAVLFEYPKRKPVPVEDYTKKQNRLYTPQHVGRRMMNVVHAWEKWKASGDREPVQVAEGIVEYPGSGNGKPLKPVKLEDAWASIGENQFGDDTDLYQAQAERAVGSSFPSFSLHVVPRRKAVRYSGIDAAATRLLDKPTAALITARGLDATYEMDRRALLFVDRMQEVGMRVDLGRLREFEADLETLRDKARRKVQSIVGDRWFNPGSAPQVGAWLYHYRGLPVLKETEGGAGSTSDEALQMLRGYHAQDPEVAEFLTGIQDYRETSKYLTTHLALIVDALKQDKATDDWQVHADFRITRVVSGRLSSWMLTIPVRTDLGRRFRHLFVARDGWEILDCDLSQLELRIGAHYSRDRRMRRAFEDGEDLHALTASIIFKKVLAAIGKDSAERYVAKTINFAVFYGIMARALLENLYKAGIFDFTLEDCERFIKVWFETYPSVRDFQRRLWRQAEQDGFVRTMWGRICYVPNLRVMDDRLREAAQRLAANFPVQGSGSDTTKRAEIRVYDYIEENGLRDEVWPWLQMHDELVLEVRKERVQEMKVAVEAAMVADQGRFSVPIKAEAKTGESWGEAKG